ncbi:hypothetical protein Rsub_05563 [Raphidocelis subcapitata]|uniref:Domain of unknown function at the cortex 1 domain-containing protein n=1 Tax=Raphidocelis subcapitata TaxID=307507 RepID=A0A2V0NXK5_9CHLO|nr:hypothetical protein Rsub_05563 [Raphidocelis subcapitata]|eukprot:GBF92361.1 hypothetical protein Rsub_05563 [Raphidocelis subcapitata]
MGVAYDEVFYDAHEGDDDEPVSPTAADGAPLAADALAAPPPFAAGAAPAASRSIWKMLVQSRAETVLPRHRPAMPSIEALRASPHRPVLVTADPGVTGPRYCGGPFDPAAALPINGKAFDVDSDMFKGRLVIHINGLATTDPAVFAGKKRTIHIAAQGKFKRRVRVGALCTGQEYHAPMGKGLEWLSEQLMRGTAKMFSRTTLVNAHGSEPYFLNPVMAACQLVNVSEEGREPEIFAATEDCRRGSVGVCALLTPALRDASGQPLPAERRRRWCDDPAHLEGLYFGTDHVYTFHVWQHLIDFSSYKAHISGFMNVDLTYILLSQPVGVMVKDVDRGDYAYSLLAWHERLLYPEAFAEAERAAARERLARGVSRLFGGFKGLMRTGSGGGGGGGVGVGGGAQ